jgi:hypothetical protein
METVTINGKTYTLADLAAAYQSSATELGTTQAALNAANSKIGEAAQAQAAFKEAQENPAFARQLADRLRELHKDSAHWADENVDPNVDPTANVDPAAVTLPPQGQTAPQATPDFALAKQVEDLQAQLNKELASRRLESVKAQVMADFPGLNFDDVLKDAVERGVQDFDMLPVLAAARDRDRLQGELSRKRQSETTLGALLGDRPDDEALSLLGASEAAVSAFKGEEPDYGALSVEDAVLLAMKGVDSAEVV